MSLLARFAGHDGVMLDPHEADQDTEDDHYQNANQETPTPKRSVGTTWDEKLRKVCLEILDYKTKSFFLQFKELTQQALFICTFLGFIEKLVFEK